MPWWIHHRIAMNLQCWNFYLTKWYQIIGHYLIEKCDSIHELYFNVFNIFRNHSSFVTNGNYHNVASVMMMSSLNSVIGWANNVCVWEDVLYKVKAFIIKWRLACLITTCTRNDINMILFLSVLLVWPCNFHLKG